MIFIERWVENLLPKSSDQSSNYVPDRSTDHFERKWDEIPARLAEPQSRSLDGQDVERDDADVTDCPDN
jgi:hypothetical protein